VCKVARAHPSEKKWLEGRKGLKNDPQGRQVLLLAGTPPPLGKFLATLLYKSHLSNILFGLKYFYNSFLINFYLIRLILRLYLFKIPLHHHHQQRPPINRVHGLEHYLLVAIMVIVISHRHQVIYCLIMIQMRIH